MATKRKTRHARPGKKNALGDTDQPVVVAVRNRNSVTDTLFKRTAGDSIFKDTVVVALSLGLAYYGSKLLIGNIGDDLANAKNKSQTNDILNSVNNPTAQPGKAIAVELAYAINPHFDSTNPKDNWSIWSNSVGGSGDANRIFRVLAGERKQDIWGNIYVVKGTYGLVQSREYYLSIVGYYKTLTGRDLETDLRQALDAFARTGNWDALQPYIRKIMCLSRITDKKTGKVTYKNIC